MSKKLDKILKDIEKTKKIIENLKKQINSCKNDKDREKLNQCLTRYKIILDDLMYKKWETI